MEVILKNLKRKICSLFITSLFFIQLCLGINNQRQFVRVINDNTRYPQTRLDFTFPDKTPLNCQTLTYLNQPTLRKYLEDCYAYKINLIGSPFFENLINSIIEKEIELKDSHYVLYHGQKLEFMLLHDLFDNLYKTISKKNLKDFFMLRVPDKDFDNFKKIKDFLEYHKKTGKIHDSEFDSDSEIKKILIAVNPSLFGNSRFEGGECSFTYFLFSENVSSLSFLDLAQNIFDFFKISYIYNKYSDKIQELINLLSEDQKTKTGILLQIFIPKENINDLVYRCIPFGNPYYSDTLKKHNSTFKDLDIYQNNFFSYLTTSDDIDRMQFRLLVNEKLTNPDSGIKMFRYFNETENVKQYKKELQNLVEQISKDLLGKTPKITKK